MIQWLVRVLGIQLASHLVKRFSLWLGLIIKKAKNKELREKLENAQTEEERKAAARAILDRLE